MMMEPLVTKHLLFEHFAGRSTPLQKRLIETWLHTQANRELFYTWLLEWEHQSPSYLPDLDSYFEQYSQHMTTSRLEPLPANSIPPERVLHMSRRQWPGWTVAASVSLLLGLLGWLNQDRIIYHRYQSAYGETRTLHLADGSMVTLNANSSLAVPRFGFGHQTRQVVLAGEAVFSVKHTPDDQPFLVKTSRNFEVVVLGTEFSVFSRNRGGKVVLNKGKVQLRYQQGAATRQVMMKPGDLITLDPHNHLRQAVTRHPQDHSSWQEHRFIFENTRLGEVAAIVAETYGVNLIISDSALANRTLQGSFRATSAQELSEIIADLFDLSVTRSADGIVLTQKP